MTRHLLRVVLVEFGAEDVGGQAIVLGRLLRDDGVEVVYTGRLGALEEIVRTVEQEDPDIAGVVGASTTLTALADALPDMILFAVGHDIDGLTNVFGTADEAAIWVAGVRSHTLEAPSDRVR